MHSKTLLLATLLLASPVSANAACTPTRSATEANNQEPKILVPFALPIGLPVAPFAPYFYSAAQFQPVGQVFNLPAQASGVRSQELKVPAREPLTPDSQLLTPTSSPAHLLTGSPAHSSDSRPPTPETSSLPTVPQPLTTALCSSCHSGPAPKANLSLDHPDTLSLTDRLRAIRAIASGQMPKGSKLTDNELRALIQELSSVGQVSNLPSQR